MTEKTKAPKDVPSEEGKNIMRTIKIGKIVLSVGATGDELVKGVKLLKVLSGKKAAKMRSRKRIPAWGVRPGLEIGAVVTIRKGIEEILKKMLAAIDNQLRRKQISTNNFSFGIKEYLEIPGMEYQRDIGIMGLDVTVVFKRSGRRVKLKKVKRSKFSKRQKIRKEEIIKFMEEKFGIEFIGK